MEGHLILKNYGGCQLIRRQDKYVVRYDNGGVVVQLVEREISKENKRYQ